MKVTRLGPPRPLLVSGSLGQTGSGVPTGGNIGEVLTATGSNSGRYWFDNVARITSNGSNTLLGPFVNFASGSNTIFSVTSNTLNIAAVASAGSSTFITSNGSNSLSGTINLQAGVGIALGVSGQTITITNTGVPGAAGSGGSSTAPPTLLQAVRANGTNTITAMSSGQRIVVGIVSYGGTVTGVTCTNVTFTQVGTDLSFNSNKTSVWVGVATGTSGTSITYTGSGTILNIACVIANTLTPTLGTQVSATSSIGYLDLSVRSNAPTVGQLVAVVGMTDNTSTQVYPWMNGSHTPVPTSVSVQATCMALGYVPGGDLVVAAKGNVDSSGVIYAVTIT